MRKNLFSFLIRMAIVAVLMTGGTLDRTFSHDLPNYFPEHQLGADCLGVKLPLTPPKLAPAAVAAPANLPNKVRQAEAGKMLRFANPSSTLTLGLAYSDAAWKAVSHGAVARQLSKQLDRLSSLVRFSQLDAVAPAPSPVLMAALPDEAPAPCPTACLTPSPTLPAAPAFSATVATLPLPLERNLTKQNYVEDYLPYDLCIRDWRFGQYSYRGLSRIAHLATPAAEVTHADELRLHKELLPTPESLAHGEALGNALNQLFETQCIVYSELCGFDFAYDLGAFAATQYQSLSSATAQQALQLARAISKPKHSPYYSEPVFVVYEMDGKSFVVPAERAKQWQAIRAALHPAEVKPVELSSVAENFDSCPSCPLRKSVLSFASQQLTYFGNKVLNIAASIESLSDVQVAGRKNGQEVR